MPAIVSSAPGKVILCGEHAVVYGQPAIALPVFSVSTSCRVIAKPNSPSNEIQISAPKIGLKTELSKLSPDNPIRSAVHLCLDELKIDHLPSSEILINSTLPTAAGMGSSASTTVAIIRAVSSFLGHPLTLEKTNQIAFEIEIYHHGTPSGVDNTVITYGKPIYFIKNSPFEILHIERSTTILIADSGIKSSTVDVVLDVKKEWEQSPKQYDEFFTQIGTITKNIKNLLLSGNNEQLGKLLNENHLLLQKMNISCRELDQLVNTSIENGAFGAKLSGGGRGGNIIALIDDNDEERITKALFDAGAVRVISTHLPLESMKK